MAESGRNAALKKQARRAARQIGPVRLIGTVLFLVLGLMLARFSWSMPLASDAERFLYDMRFYVTSPKVLEQDPRIVLVTFNDDTLEQLGKRSPLDRRMLAQALRVIDGMNPRVIGVDILIDQPQPEDPELLETLRNMRTPTLLAYASSDRDYGNPEQMLYWQEQFLRDFIAQARPGPVAPASIKLQPDQADGVLRRWTRQDPRLPTFLAPAMSPVFPGFRNYVRAIDYRIAGSDEVTIFANLPIQLFSAIETEGLGPEERAALAEGFRSQIEDKYVLIGGDINDQDDFETPMSRFTGRTTKGVEIHAHMLAQQLDGRMPRAVPDAALWLVAIAVVVAGALTSLLEISGWRLALVLVFQLLFFVGLPFWAEWTAIDTLGLPAFGWGMGWLFAFVGVGTAARAVGSEQKRFAQTALGKYLPVDIANEIMRDPDQLSLHGDKRQIYALFTDLEGFTSLSHAITPEQLSTLFNGYLDVMSDVVLRHGGTIDKFIGDAVVAFWGAPIARPDDADRAVQAAIAMYEAGQEFARNAGADIPPIGRTRVGLHRGEVVVGNFGGEGRIQYTALGDGMNTAARLESANKAMKTTILVSDDARRDASLDIFRPMGRIVLSGRATPVIVWEPVPDMPADQRRKLVELWERFDSGDATALRELEEIAVAQSDDEALAFFVYRLGEAGSGGHFVLGSK